MLARQSTDVSGEAASGTVPSISTSRCCAVRWAAAGALTLPAAPTIRWLDPWQRISMERETRLGQPRS